MFGSLVRWPLTWRWLTSVVTLSHGHVFVEVPPGNINSVSTPVTSSNLFFPATEAFPAQSGYFSFALYITKVALKGRVVLENPDQVGDPSAAQVTQLVGIILPFLLHNSVQIPGGKGAAPRLTCPSTNFVSLYWTPSTPPLKLASLPPISLSLSFLVPVSAFPGLFQHLVGVPFIPPP